MTKKNCIIISLCFYFILNNTLAQQNWISLEDFPGIARDDASHFVIDNKAYVGLGFNANFQYCKDFYSFSNNEGWKRIIDFPAEERQYSASFTYNGNGYVFGGIGFSGAMNDLWVYSPSTDNWNLIGHSPFGSLFSTAAIVENHKVFFIGGLVSENTFSDRIIEFDLINHSWKSYPSAVKLRYHQSFRFNNQNFIAGGLNNANEKQNTIYLFDFFQKSLLPFSELPFGLSQFGAVIKNNNLIICSGEKDDNTFLNQLIIFDMITFESTFEDGWDNNGWRGSAVFLIDEKLISSLGIDENFNRTNKTYQYSGSLLSIGHQKLSCDFHLNKIDGLPITLINPCKKNIELNYYDLNGKLFVNRKSKEMEIPLSIKEISINGLAIVEIVSENRIQRLKILNLTE